MFIDYDLELLTDVLRPLDKQLEGIVRESTQVSDPDGFGYFDRAEHITGLGFVACQWYMASMRGSLRVRKLKALALGPLHRSGLSVEEIINHAANYWKHYGEWPIDKNSNNQRRITEAFEEIGFPVGTDYPLSGILTEIVAPSEASFGSLIKLLECWRDELLKSKTLLRRDASV